MSQKTPANSDLRHRVTICGADEVVTSAGVLTLVRRTAFDTWAQIEPRKASAFSRDGAVLASPDESPTHVLVMRTRHDREISGAAWIYEARRMGPPRWYRVVDSHDLTCDGHWTRLRLRVVQQGDNVGQPAEPKTAAVAPVVEADGDIVI